MPLDYDLADRFNGRVEGILSVDISDWLHTEYQGKLADEADPEQVKDLVWDQLKRSLNVEGNTVLRDDMIEHWYVDRDIRWNPRADRDENIEPLPFPGVRGGIHERLDLLQRSPVIRLGPDGTDVHGSFSLHTVCASIASYCACVPMNRT